VHEALDGASALDIAFRVQPELVVSDILMPGLDGFALCRALRRDVGLRDTPVMLLSWKEDLLQRVRELGASAAAYMRKESDSRAVLARVREVLRPRARIEMRLRGDGEVRGRLDDLSPRLLLELVCAIRKDARVAVRDATFLYEVEIRGGAPRKATRTASDGSFQSGERALAMLLAVGAGRFSIASSQEPIRGELSGTLFELLARPLAAARGALAATTGQRTMEVERIVLDPTVLEEYLRATPDPARAVLKRLAGGASPRALLLAGEAAPSLVEELLADLAARCAIRGVEAADGTDLLTPAVQAALGVLTGAIPTSRSLPPNARPSVAPRPAVLPARAPDTARALDVARALVPGRVPDVAAALEPPRAPPEPVSDPPPRPLESLQWSAPPEPPRPSVRPSAGRLPVSALAPPSRVIDDDDDSGAPSSLEDAVMREISDRTPEPSPVLGGLDLPPIVEPSELRPRSSNPPANEEEASEPPDEQALLPSIPPDAIVPAASSNEEFAVLAPAVGEAATSQVEEAFQLTSEKRLVAREASLVPGPEPSAGEARVEREPARAPRERGPDREEASAEPESRKRDQASAPGEALAAAPAIVSLPPEDLHEVPEEPRVREVPAAEPPASSSSPWGLVVAFALLAGAVVAVLRMTGRDLEPQWPSTIASATSTGAALTGAAGAATTGAAGAATTGAAGAATAPSSSARAAGVGSAPSSIGSATAGPPASASAAAAGGAASDDGLPPAAAIPAGYGLLQIGAPRGARVLIDGVDAGSGPLSSSVQRAGYHQVRIDQDGKRSQYVIEVRAGKTTRVKSSPLP
jgi:CheY-like chemotaxis protein